MTVTVKINPLDGNWQTACELIKRITANNPGGELNFVVEDVFNAGKKIPQAAIRSSFTATTNTVSATKSMLIETVAERNGRHTEEFTWETKLSNSRMKNSATFE